jgi:hypothetical protein
MTVPGHRHEHIAQHQQNGSCQNLIHDEAVFFSAEVLTKSWHVQVLADPAALLKHSFPGGYARTAAGQYSSRVSGKAAASP